MTSTAPHVFTAVESEARGNVALPDLDVIEGVGRRVARRHRGRLVGSPRRGLFVRLGVVLGLLGVPLAGLPGALTSPAAADAIYVPPTLRPSYVRQRTDWMAHVPDGTRLFDLSLPGTHDAMANCLRGCGGVGELGAAYVQTQAMSLEAQLNTGVRALDIRMKQVGAELNGARFELWHGDDKTGAYLGYDFAQDVLAVVNAFLDRHPTEVVVMKIQREGGDDEAGSGSDPNNHCPEPTGVARSCFVALLERYVDDPVLGRRVHYPTDPKKGSGFASCTANPGVTVKEARGKIVILPNLIGSYGSVCNASLTFGTLNMQGNLALAQKDNESNSGASKGATALAFLQTPKPPSVRLLAVDLTMNPWTIKPANPLTSIFALAYGSPTCFSPSNRAFDWLVDCPRADGPNDMLLAWLNEQREAKNRYQLGLVFMDFPEYAITTTETGFISLIDAIILHNPLLLDRPDVAYGPLQRIDTAPGQRDLQLINGRTVSVEYSATVRRVDNRSLISIQNPTDKPMHVDRVDICVLSNVCTDEIFLDQQRFSDQWQLLVNLSSQLIDPADPSIGRDSFRLQCYVPGRSDYLSGTRTYLRDVRISPDRNRIVLAQTDGFDLLPRQTVLCEHNADIGVFATAIVTSACDSRPDPSFGCLADLDRGLYRADTNNSQEVELSITGPTGTETRRLGRFENARSRTFSVDSRCPDDNGSQAVVVSLVRQPSVRSAATLQITCSKAAQTIAVDPTVIGARYQGPPYVVSATASSGLPPTFRSLTPTVCQLQAGSALQRTVAFSGAGRCILRVEQPGDDTYAAADPVDVSFDVARATQQIDFPLLPPSSVGRLYGKPAVTASSGLPVTLDSDTPSVCTADSGQVIIRAAGSCSLRARQAGDANFLPAEDVVRTLAIDRAAQTIEFAALPDRPLQSAPFLVEAFSSMDAFGFLPIAFTSDTPTTCSVAGSRVTLLAGGPCMIRASQPGNASFLPAPDVTRSFEVVTGRERTALASAVLADAPSGYWHLDSSSATEPDVTGHGQPARYVGAGRRGPGIDGSPDRALRLNDNTATNDHVEVADDGSLSFARDFTIEAWVNTSGSRGNYQMIVTKSPGADAGAPGQDPSNYELWLRPDLVPEFRQTAGAGNPMAHASRAITVGHWTHLVVTKSGSTVTFFIDGAAAGSTHTNEPVSRTSGRPVQIGSRSDQGDIAYFTFRGLLDEIALYDHALTPDRIAAHYRAAAAT